MRAWVFPRTASLSETGESVGTLVDDGHPAAGDDRPTAEHRAASDRRPPTGSRWRPLILLLLPLAVYLALVALLGDWIMDDAGISYAYARNLAFGHGPVSQPGRPPVEGFSNFLWVVLLAPLFRLHLFDPVVTAKALGALLVLASLVMLQRTLRREFDGWAPALLATTLIAGAPPIVIWTAAGLENSLTMFLAVALYDRLARMPRRWEIYDWVFETIKPTFINTHDFFTYTTALERDPRFTRDYVAVNAYRDEYVQSAYGSAVHSGDYVRKDVLRGPRDLRALQEGYQASPAPDPPLRRWRARLPRWLGGPGEVRPEELMTAGLGLRYSVRNPNGAASLFRRALEAAPRHYGATYQLATALDAAGRADEARPVWERVQQMALAAGNVGVSSAAGERLGGEYRPGADDSMRAGLVALYTLRDPQRAIEQFRLVLAENPGHYGATYQLAAALDAGGRRTEAVPLWEKVLGMATGYDDRRTADAARARLQQGGR